jgi:cell division protein FtsB
VAEELQREVERLHAEAEALKSTNEVLLERLEGHKNGGAEDPRVQEYPDLEMNIRVSQTHGEDSFVEEKDDEVAQLRSENAQLRKRISDLEDREPIPLDEKLLNEVVVQTLFGG